MRYSYEDVKEAYAAFIEVRKCEANEKYLGWAKAKFCHSRNLKALDRNAKDLYMKLISDETINY